MIWLWGLLACTESKSTNSDTRVVSQDNAWSATLSRSPHVETVINIDIIAEGSATVWATAETNRTTLTTLPQIIEDTGRISVLGLLPGEEADIEVTIAQDNTEVLLLPTSQQENYRQRQWQST